MINWLSIRHFAIASEVELELGPGFTAITGETGSGKSLLVDALGILLGDRAEQGLIQQGEEQAEIRGGFVLPENSPIMEWLTERDLQGDSELILRRIIRRDRSGRNYINGNPVNLSQLKELGDQLVDIHGQHEHHSLLQKSTQQSLLDAAASNLTFLHKLSSSWDELRAIDRQLDQLQLEQQNVVERIELLQFQLRELTELNPGEDEWESLSQRQRRLAHATELMQCMDAAITQLYESEQSAQTQISRVAGNMRQYESLEPALREIAEILEEAEVNVNEAVNRIRGYLNQVDPDEDELQRVEERLSAWHAICRKYRIPPNTLADYRSDLESTLQQLQDPQLELAALAARKAEAEQVCHHLADQISANRHQAVSRLSGDITNAIQKLGMVHGQFEIRLEKNGHGSLTRTGWESVAFEISTNPGQAMQPLHRIASGGELSRISLAIQVILADGAKTPTMIFDEVDVGIGGTIANIVGDQLRQLGQSNQVVSVTHLPQVASRANQHYYVAKRDSTDSVVVKFELLDRPGRITEIARMSGSKEPSHASREHAKQMLDSGDPR